MITKSYLIVNSPKIETFLLKNFTKKENNVEAIRTSANYSGINLIAVSQSTSFCFRFKGFCDINEQQIKDPDRLFNSPFNQFQHNSPLMCLITKVNSLSVTNCANKERDWNTCEGCDLTKWQNQGQRKRNRAIKPDATFSNTDDKPERFGSKCFWYVWRN